MVQINLYRLFIQQWYENSFEAKHSSPFSLERTNNHTHFTLKLTSQTIPRKNKSLLS